MQEVIDSLIEHIRSSNGYYPKGKAIRLAERIDLHYDDTTTSEKAKNFLKEKAPNQSPEEFEYELRNFRIWSRRILLKIMGMFGKIANPNNYDFTVSDEELSEYLNTDYPFYGSFKNYISSALLDGKLLDSNAVRVTRPYFMPTLEKDGKIVFDDTQNIKSIDEIYESKRVVHFDDDNLFIGLSTEKSIVKYRSREDQIGLIFDIYDKNGIYRLVQYGEKIDYNFNFEVFYMHNMGFLPCNQLKGKQIVREGKILYNSPLNFITDELDSYLKISSNLNTGVLSRVFAERVEVIDHDCVTCRGTGVEQIDVDGEISDVTCRTCNGTTALPRPSVMSSKIIKTNETNPEAFNQLYPGLTYVSPPVDGLDFLDKMKKEKEQEIYQTMNHKLTNSVTSGKEQTATGEKIDKEEQYTMLMQWADQLFESVDLSLRAHCGYWQLGTEYTLIKPISYNIRTEDDLNKEIDGSDNLPSSMRSDIYKQYVTKRFAENSTIRKYLDDISRIDRLFGMSPNEKKSSQSVQMWELILSESIVFFIESIENFESMSFEARKEALIALAKGYIQTTRSVEEIE